MTYNTIRITRKIFNKIEIILEPLSYSALLQYIFQNPIHTRIGIICPIILKIEKPVNTEKAIFAVYKIQKIK